MKSKLADRVRGICSTYWSPAKTRCQGCPIMSACHSPAEPLTQASLDAWRARVNAAAEAVTPAPPESAQ